MIKNAKVFILTIIVATLPFLSQAKNDADSWVTVKPARTKLQINFPVTPKSSEIDRGSHLAYSLTADHDAHTFHLVYSVHKESSSKAEQEQFMDNMVKTYVNSYKAKIKSDNKFKVDEVEGREITLKLNKDKYLVFRMFFQDNIFYTASISSDKKSPKKSVINDFFDSMSFSDHINAPTDLPSDTKETNTESSEDKPQADDSSSPDDASSDS